MLPQVVNKKARIWRSNSSTSGEGETSNPTLVDALLDSLPQIERNKAHQAAKAGLDKTQL